jgi:hypothetical protein
MNVVWKKKEISSEDFSSFNIYVFSNSIYSCNESGLYEIIIQNKKHVIKQLLISKDLKYYQFSELNNELYIFGSDGMFKINFEKKELINMNYYPWVKKTPEYNYDNHEIQSTIIKIDFFR